MSSTNDKGGKFCPHCSQIVAPRTYYLHKNQHFDVQTKQWQKEFDLSQYSSSDDSTFDVDSPLITKGGLIEQAMDLSDSCCRAGEESSSTVSTFIATYSV